MNKSVILIFSLVFALHVMASDESKEEPVQHLKIADVTSMKDAKKVFIEKTSEIRSKKNLTNWNCSKYTLLRILLRKV